MHVCPYIDTGKFLGVQFRGFHRYRISSKSRRTSKSRRPRNLTAPGRRLVPINAAHEISPHGKGSSDSTECRHTRAIRNIGMDECAGARRVSGLVAPPSKFRRRVQRLEIKCRRGEISRKYGVIHENSAYENFV